MRTGLLVLAVLLSGCHARFKKHVNLVEAVRPDVIVTTGPSVNLGGANTDDNLVNAVVNVVQAVKSVQAAGRLGDAVDINGVNQAFASSLIQTLGGGPPFPTSGSPGSSLLQVEVVDYGLESPGIGIAGTFNYTLHVSIYLPDGQKIYNAHEKCNVAFGEASAVVQALGLVNNIRQLNKMTDEEIQAVFEGAATVCGRELVLKIRRHASGAKPSP